MDALKFTELIKLRVKTNGSKISGRDMGRKKDKPKEIPIKFADDESVISEETGECEDIAQGSDPLEAAETGEPQAEHPQTEEDEGSELGDFAKFTLELAEVQDRVETLTREKAVLYDQVLRRQAEFENYRKRVDKEKTDYYQRMRAEVLLELLPVLDNFDRALASLASSEGDRESLHQGVELIHRQFSEALKKLGLQPVEAIGHMFDPHVHEAITVEPTDQHEENTIMEEFERGYRLGDRLLRPAKVKVAAALES